MTDKKNAAQDVAASQAAATKGAAMSSLSEADSTNYNRNGRDDSRDTEKAHLTAVRAYDWIHRNQDAFLDFCESMSSEARAGRKASPYRARENYRAKDFLDSDGNYTRTPNELTPYLVRIFLVDHSEARPFVKLGHSHADLISLRGAARLLDEPHGRAYQSL